MFSRADILQEYSENQCYMRALSNMYLENVHIDLPNVPQSRLIDSRLKEKMSVVMAEPIGMMMFRYFLNKTNTLEHLLFLNDVEVRFTHLPFLARDFTIARSLPSACCPCIATSVFHRTLPTFRCHSWYTFRCSLIPGVPLTLFEQTTRARSTRST